MKKTKKQRSKTFPSIGNVSSKSMTKIRMDGTRLIARNGRRTRTVRIADKLRLSPGINASTNLNRDRSYAYIFFSSTTTTSYPATTIKQSNRFHVSARYVPLP